MGDADLSEGSQTPSHHTRDGDDAASDDAARMGRRPSDSGVMLAKSGGCSVSPLNQSSDSLPLEETGDIESLWPTISIEMDAVFKICSAEDLDVWYFVDCKYVRIVRWSGL